MGLRIRNILFYLNIFILSFFIFPIIYLSFKYREKLVPITFFIFLFNVSKQVKKPQRKIGYLRKERQEQAVLIFWNIFLQAHSLGQEDCRILPETTAVKYLPLERRRIRQSNCFGTWETRN